MSADVLSEVLRAVRLTGALFFDVVGTEPWVAEAPAAQSIAARVLPGSQHVMEFHVAVEGGCYCGLADGEPVHMAQGDIVVFPQGDAHRIASGPSVRGRPEPELYRHPERGHLPIGVELDGGGSTRARIVCGFLGCDAFPFNPLLASLPRLLHVQSSRRPPDGPLTLLVAAALRESAAPRAGSEVLLARMSELMFIDVVRHYLDELPHDTTGWLAGLRDPVIGRALAALHDRPAQDWTLELLAREVGISRSLLAERFHQYVGVPPMQYLASWRMQLASSWLSTTNLSLSEVAARVGYGSEAALSRAFKRLVGVPPSSVRARNAGP